MSSSSSSSSSSSNYKNTGSLERHAKACEVLQSPLEVSERPRKACCVSLPRPLRLELNVRHCDGSDGLTRSPAKSHEEGQEDQGDIKELGPRGTPLGLSGPMIPLAFFLAFLRGPLEVFRGL